MSALQERRTETEGQTETQTEDRLADLKYAWTQTIQHFHRDIWWNFFVFLADKRSQSYFRLGSNCYELSRDGV